MKIALGDWKFCHIFFETSLTTYKTNKLKKRNTGSPKERNRYISKTRGSADFPYLLDATEMPIFMLFSLIYLIWYRPMCPLTKDTKFCNLDINLTKILFKTRSSVPEAARPGLRRVNVHTRHVHILNAANLVLNHHLPMTICCPQTKNQTSIPTRLGHRPLWIL